MVPEKKEEKMLSLPAEEPRLLNRQKIGRNGLGIELLVFHISNSIRTRKIICAPPTNLFPGVIKTVEPLRNDEAEALFLSRAQSPLNHFLNL